MNEDVDSVSPTLGFIIKTIDYEGLVRSIYYHLPCLPSAHEHIVLVQKKKKKKRKRKPSLTKITKVRYKLNICKQISLSSTPPYLHDLIENKRGYLLIQHVIIIKGMSVVNAHFVHIGETISKKQTR